MRGRSFWIPRNTGALGLELTFYLVAPFLVRRKTWVVVAIVLASILFRIWMPEMLGMPKLFGYRFLPFELALFMSGCLGYKLYRAARENALGSAEFAGSPFW